MDPARKLTATLGRSLGVDLTASPARMQIVDDASCLPGVAIGSPPRRSNSSLSAGGCVGPTPRRVGRSWETAAGAGAFLRLNKSAYLVAVETGADGAAALEVAAHRSRLLATGTARNLDDARAGGRGVRDRYPALTAPAVDTGASPGGTVDGWEQMPRGGARSPPRSVT